MKNLWQWLWLAIIVLLMVMCYREEDKEA